MKKLLNYSTLVAVTLVLISTACTKNSSGGVTVVFKPSKGEPLAQVGKTTLALEEMNEDFLARQGTFRGAPHLNTEKKRTEFVENEVIQEAMFQEALALDYFNNPEVRRNIKKIVVQKLMRDKLEQAQTQYVPTEQEIKEHYEKNPNLYNREEGAKVAYFAIPFGTNKTEAKKLADALQKDAHDTVKNANTKEFARLAIKHAQTAASKTNVSIETNETPFLERAGFEAKFGPVFDLVKNMENIGQVAPVLTTDAGYFVIMKTGFRKALNETIEEAKPKIQKRIAFEQRGKVYENFVAELRKKYNVKIFQEKVAELGKNAGTPPAVAANAQMNAPNAVGNAANDQMDTGNVSGNAVNAPSNTANPPVNAPANK